VPGQMTITRRSFIVMTAALAACKTGAEILRFSGATMGTTYNVTAIDHDRSVNGADLGQGIEAALAQVTREMSNWDAGSELSRLNAAAPGEALPVSPALYQVLAGAQHVHRASEGRFDVSIGPLIELWGFGAGGAQARVPEAAEIAQALDRVGQDRVLTLEDGAVRKNEGGAAVYLSGIGKGHGVDRVAQVLRDAGLRDFMVEIGGDLYASGRNGDGTDWQIGVESPLPGLRDVTRVLGVSRLGMATSGDYRNFFEAGGRRYCHIIDPTTGAPISHATVSATVLTEDAMLADAWSTAMLTLGRDRGLKIAEAQNLAVLFIETTGSGFVTHESSRLTALTA
jgi:FAD:protein FMN transferase